jgi:hypothetical protein
MQREKNRGELRLVERNAPHTDTTATLRGTSLLLDYG